MPLPSDSGCTLWRSTPRHDVRLGCRDHRSRPRSACVPRLRPALAFARPASGRTELGLSPPTAEIVDLFAHRLRLFLGPRGALPDAPPVARSLVAVMRAAAELCPPPPTCLQHMVFRPECRACHHCGSLNLANVLVRNVCSRSAVRLGRRRSGRWAHTSVYFSSVRGRLQRIGLHAPAIGAACGSLIAGVSNRGRVADATSALDRVALRGGDGRWPAVHDRHSVFILRSWGVEAGILIVIRLQCISAHVVPCFVGGHLAVTCLRAGHIALSAT